ncbi:MAG: hypothetical protein OHK0046_18790 [Anaerolineae bacterium]
MFFTSTPQPIPDTLDSAQQQMINAWLSMIDLSALEAAGTNRDTLAELWRGIVQQGIRQMTALADPVVGATAERIFLNHLNTLRFIEFSAQTWTQVFEAIQTGQDWQQVMAAHMAQVRQEWSRSVRDGLYLNSSPREMWRAFIEEGCAYTVLMPEPLRRAALENALHTTQNPTDTHWDAYSENFTRFMTSPVSAHMQRVRAALEQSFTAWREMQTLMALYHEQFIETWLRAFTLLMQDMGELVQGNEFVESVRVYLNRWSATADDAFQQTFRTPAFIQMQSRVINAAMVYQQRQNHLSDAIMVLYGLPTRRELDEAHRRIQTLRREMKTLRQEMAALRELVSQNHPLVNITSTDAAND